MNNLAALLRKMEKFSEAEGLYRKALVIREDALGQDNPQVSSNLLYVILALMLRSLSSFPGSHVK